MLTGYTMEIFRSKCNAGARTLHCFAHLNDDVSEVLPFLNTVLGGFTYTQEPPSLTLKNSGKLITIHARKIAVNALKDEDEAEKIVVWLSARSTTPGRRAEKSSQALRAQDNRP